MVPLVTCNIEHMLYTMILHLRPDFSIMRTALRAMLLSMLWIGLISCASAQLPLLADGYCPPALDDVLPGKAPLRVLLFDRLPMLAWKGEGNVQVLCVTSRENLYLAKMREQIGAVFDTERSQFSLRRNNQNFCRLPGAVRLQSDKPILIWQPGSDAWVRCTSPLIVIPSANNSYAVAQEIMLEDYLRFVVPSEMPSSFHPQALRAQAVIARTYTLSKLGRHRASGADLCASVHCQAFNTESKRVAATDAAVRDTAGQVLFSGAQLAVTYYHANCGGTTDDAAYVWGAEYAAPYLCGIIDSKRLLMPVTVQELYKQGDRYCSRASNASWTRQFTPAMVNDLVRKNLVRVTGNADLVIASVTAMQVTSRTPNGRAYTLRVEGEGGSAIVYGDKIRWLFGTGNPGAEGLWSTLFDLNVDRNEAGKITGYTFTGAGRGHGLGLCQWGADGRGKAGQSYREILQAYYPGTIVGR